MIEPPQPRISRWLQLRAWLPSRGSVLLVFVTVLGLLIYERQADASRSSSPAAASTAVIPYQGRLADSNGVPLDGAYSISFRLYTAASGGGPLWTETWNAGNVVTVSEGLFSVLLGSLAPLPQSLFAGNDSLWLGISVGGDEEMTPRVQLGSAPYSMRASVVNYADLVPNVQTVYDYNQTEISVVAHGTTDIISTTITTTQPSLLRLSYHSLVWKTVNPGRTAIGIRVGGAPNTWVIDSCAIAAGTPVADYVEGSETLGGVCFVPVASGVHTVTLVLGSWDNGTSHARYFGLNVEVLRQP